MFEKPHRPIANAKLSQAPLNRRNAYLHSQSANMRSYLELSQASGNNPNPPHHPNAMPRYLELLEATAATSPDPYFELPEAPAPSRTIPSPFSAIFRQLRYPLLAPVRSHHLEPNHHYSGISPYQASSSDRRPEPSSPSHSIPPPPLPSPAIPIPSPSMRRYPPISSPPPFSSPPPAPHVQSAVSFSVHKPLL